MGKRDIGHRETKKPRKDLKKPIIATAVTPPPTAPPVEIIKKRRKLEGEEE